jgi:hypothetical protein
MGTLSVFRPVFMGDMGKYRFGLTFGDFSEISGGNVFFPENLAKDQRAVGILQDLNVKFNVENFKLNAKL